jgi:hypothetical protein
MKKFIKRLIKEAVLDALREWFYPVNTRANLTGPDGPGNGNGTGTETGEGDEPKPDENLNNGTESGGEKPGEGSAATGGGGITDDGRPRPDVGVGVF